MTLKCGIMVDVHAYTTKNGYGECRGILRPIHRNIHKERPHLMTTINEPLKQPRVYSVEFWRFAFTVIVALYHLEIYYQKKLMPSGTSAVEFFFILAGFTIAMSAARRVEHRGKRETDSREAHALALDYLKKKLKAIYPLLALTLVIALVVIPVFGLGFTFSFGAPAPEPSFGAKLLDGLKSLINSEWEWLMMVGTPAGFNNETAISAPIVPLWFLTQLLLVGYLYTFLVNRKYDLMMFLAPVISVIGFTFFLLNSEHNLDFYIKMGLFNAGTVRALTQMAMGISIFQIYQRITSRDWSLFGKIILQLLELFAIYRYCALTFGAQLGMDNFKRIPYILIIILLSFSNVTLLSKLLNRKFMEKLGKLSLTMYLIHFPLASIYMNMVYSMKRNGSLTRALPNFLFRSGGSAGWYQSIPLSLGDVVMYLPFVIIISILMNLFIKAIGHNYAKLAKTKKRS